MTDVKLYKQVHGLISFNRDSTIVDNEVLNTVTIYRIYFVTMADEYTRKIYIYIYINIDYV